MSNNNNLRSYGGAPAGAQDAPGGYQQPVSHSPYGLPHAQQPLPQQQQEQGGAEQYTEEQRYAAWAAYYAQGGH